jgi:hypothetical protein
MAGIYKIGSKLGYDLANGMAAGQTIRATDGSEWTKNADGSISVLQNGQKLTGEITYQPGTQPQGVQQGAGGALTPESAAAMQGAAGYTSPYAEKLNQVIAGLGDSKWQGWDANEDPSMQAYRKQYLREAERSAEDVLGQYAQNTGGVAGSAAIAAATQASDYYKSQLADKIPQLYENAYARHLNEVAQQQNMAELLMNAESQQQNQYYDRINYAMNKWAQMGYADQEVASILGVAAGTPTSDQSYTDWSTAFQREQWQSRQAASGTAGGEEQKKLTQQQERLIAAIDSALTGEQRNKNLSGAQKLIDFMIKQGKSDEEIYEKLRVAGYDDQTIAEALAGKN